MVGWLGRRIRGRWTGQGRSRPAGLAGRAGPGRAGLVGRAEEVRWQCRWSRLPAPDGRPAAGLRAQPSGVMS
jgi:hypothetical protein